MDKDQWQQIEEIFYTAMELPHGEREGFIRQACAGDEALYGEVQTLLEANRKTESFLGTPAARPQTPVAASPTGGKHCPKCRQVYPTSTRFCLEDREILSLKDPYHLVGSTLMDKYKVKALVGVGGMGAVYCAQHLGIDRRVALKILQPNVAIGNQYVVELFEREAKLSGRLTHENIVDVKDAGHTPDGIAYIAMEWLEGQTLDEELMNQGRFGFRRAIGIIRQIAAALSAAHAERIVHRDLKPANIMLLDTPDGRDQVKVLDFGIGKILTETTGNSPVSALVGTPQYASPEQLTVGGHVDGRSDLYSLGVIFYRLIGGQLPFRCSSMSELMQMQLADAPQPLGGIRPQTPPEIEKLVHRMLAKDPARRPQSAGELSGLLNRILEELKINEPDREEIKQFSAPTRSDAGAENPHQLESNQTSEAETLISTKKSARSNRSFLLYGAALAVMMLAGSYGLYRYRSNALPVSVERKPENPVPVASPVIVKESPPTPGATATPDSEQASNRQGFLPAPALNQAQLQLNQKKAAERFHRAQSLYKQGDYQNALRECNESLKLNPRQPEARQLQQKIIEFLKIRGNR